ncbi:unnamed protein product [Effrenium voratum]|uniref:Uncharacterized protein n=1 Tax=Effrenium voratum TaxID=2562239 RepID=A0AA36IPJ4_9DINO|nr:unnamed protein product [Effrenium voratum]CAJ1403995.1 unnamed protein product [Effrenium voratum]
MGAVDREEWNAAAGHAGGNSPFQRAIIEPQSEFAFKSMDVNRDRGRQGEGERLS